MEGRKFAPDMARRRDNLLRLTSKSLYGEKVHYALELIQNAEDAESTSIAFIFDKDQVIVINDGVVLTPEDITTVLKLLQAVFILDVCFHDYPSPSTGSHSAVGALNVVKGHIGV